MSTAAWLRAAQPHPSGDTKPCLRCGRTITRASGVGARQWSSRLYCSKNCSAHAENHRRSAANKGRLAELGEIVRDGAACRDSDVDFVPDSKQDALGAMVLCHQSHCPVRSQCLAYGMATRAYGVWGGSYLVYGEAKAS